MKRLVSLVLVLALLTVCLSGCSVFRKLIEDEPEPQTTADATQSVEDMLARCVAACNNVDVDGILDCVTPKIAKPARTMMNLAGSLGDKSDEEMLESVLGLLGAEETTNAAEVCRTLSAEVQNVEVDGDSATADVTFGFAQGEKRYTGDTTLTCVCIDGQWYISVLSA